MNIQLSEEERIKLSSCDDVYGIMQRILLRENEIDQDKEHFWIIGLAQNNRLIFIELNSMGSVNLTTVDPMNVFRVAILKNTPKVVLVHNHPSGEVQPSGGDKDLTDRLIQAGKIVNVQVIEHMIITPTTYYSFRNSGLFEVLESSLKWVPSEEAIKKVREDERQLRAFFINEARKEGEKEGLEKGVEVGEKRGEEKGVKKGIRKGKKEGEKKKALEMAQEMKKDGKALEEIMKYTKLTQKEIEKL